MIGQTVSHYRILEKLGEGGMGVVYKAEDIRLKRQVALKFLPFELTRNKEVRERFVQEAQTASSLDHPNICTIHEIDETNDGRTFICMACYEGETVKEKVNRGPLQLVEAVDISIHLARGLNVAHERGIVHRDIKPANVHVSWDGQVKILDFGLAKLAGQVGITRTGTPIGTVAYMSPEQARGERVDHRTDIWSLGVVLYEMLTARLPFKAENPQLTVHAILSEDPKHLSSFRDDVPLELVRIVEKALAKDFEDRYQSAREVLDDLELLKSELDAGTTTPVPRYAWLKTRRISRKRKRFMRVTAPAVVLLAIGAGTMWFFSRDRGPDLDANRVVVAIFENRTGEESLDTIGQMAADWITQGISQLRGLSWVPLMTVLQSERISEQGTRDLDEATRLRKLAEEMRAGIVVSGSYYLEDESLHIQSRITDARSGETIQNVPPLTGSREAPMNLIEELRERVTGALALRYDQTVDPRMIEEPPTFEAYREYIAGVGLFFTNPAFAIHHFSRSAELDSTFLAPRLWLIAAFSNYGHYAKADSIITQLERNRGELTMLSRRQVEFWIASNQGNLPEGLRVIRQAHEIAPDHGFVTYLHGICALCNNRPQETLDTYAKVYIEDIYRIYESFLGLPYLNVLTKAHHLLGNHEEELEAVRVAYEYYPDKLTLKSYEIRALAPQGRIQEIFRIVDECRALSPGGVEFTSYGDMMKEAALELRAHGYQQDSREMAERAVRWYEERLLEDEESETARYRLAHALYRAERWDEARSAFDELASRNPDAESYSLYRGLLAARRGDRESATRVLENLYRTDRPYLFGENVYNCACIAALLGDKERAVELLREAFARGYAFELDLHRDMDLESLHGYPAFEKLLEPKG